MTKQLNMISVASADLDRILEIAHAPYGPRSERAIWLQIYDRLANACADGSLESGARLPGENDLAHMFSVTRLTMRKALSKLQQEGRLQARKGVGVFVRRPPARYRVEDGLRFSERLQARAEGIETHTLALTSGTVSVQGARALNIPEGAPVVVLRRLRIVGGEPIYLTNKEFPADRFPDFEAAYVPRQSVADVFAAHGIERFTRAETRIAGGFAGRREAEALRLTQRTPLLFVSATNHDPEKRPIEFSSGCWPLASVELVFGPNVSGNVRRS